MLEPSTLVDEATRARILVLDDEPMLRRALERAATSRADVELETVGTPDELLDRVPQGRPPDLIVCDYRLKVDGRSTTSAELLRELSRRGLRVAVMTGDVGSIASDLAGIPAVQKPLRLEDLVALVRGQ